VVNPDDGGRAGAGERGGTGPGADPEVTYDRLLGGRVALAQPRHGYRAAVDPVLLAAAVPLQPGEHALELGCGAGAAALCLLARVPDGRVTGLEQQPALARLARDNAAANGAGERLSVHAGDLLDPPAAIGRGGFDHAFANPPYLAAGTADAPADPLRAAANVEGAARLPDWIAALARATRRGGTLTVIHRADRLPELLAQMDRVAGGLVTCPLWPTAGTPAKRVLVQGRVGVGGPATLTAGLTLHAGGGFTPEARAVLEDVAALALR
jgi:tRNA1(Val) A37 N6-methylase TrmN6